MSSYVRGHIAKRVIQACNNLNCSSFKQENIKSLLTVKEVCGDFINIQLPINKCLGKIKEKDISNILNAKQDSIIQGISEHLGNYRTIIFSIRKDTFMEDIFNSTVNSCLSKKDDPKRLIVEFSSPNVAKPFHMGHLRSTIVGNFIANMKDLSDKVVRLNYLGDWGTQVGFIKVGLDRSNVNLVEGNPIKTLYEVYVAANKDENLLNEAKKAFTMLEQGDLMATSQWERIRSLTIEHLKTVYRKLGIIFDEYACESMYSSRIIAPLFDSLKKEGLLEQINGVLGIMIEGSLKPLSKSDGSSLYLGRDIAAALDRVKRHKCDQMLYVVDKSQSDHLNSLQYIINKILNKNIIIHVPFGRVIGMSTRKGTGIFLSDILEKAVDVMAAQQAQSPNTRTNNPDTTRNLAVSALIIYILQYRRMRDFHFDWEEALRSTGDTGVKLQYTHSRLVSLEKKCGVDLPSEINPKYLTESLAIQLAIEIFRFEEVLTLSQENLESYHLVNYSFKLCNLISQSLKILPIKGQPKELGEQRLMLFHCSRKVLNRLMKILGMTPLQCM